MSRDKSNPELRRMRTATGKIESARKLDQSAADGLKKLIVASPENLNTILADLSSPENKKLYNAFFKELMSEIVPRIWESNTPAVVFDNIKALISFNREFAYILLNELKKPENSEKLGGVLARVMDRGLMSESLVSREQLLGVMKSVENPENDVKDMMLMISLLDEYKNYGMNASAVKMLAVSNPVARALLIHYAITEKEDHRFEGVVNKTLLSALTVDDPISAKDLLDLYARVGKNPALKEAVKDTIVQIFDSDDPSLKNKQFELATLMKERELNDDFSADIPNIDRYSDSSFLTRTSDEKELSAGERTARYWLAGLQGVGLSFTDKKDLSADEDRKLRLSAFTGNIFEDTKNVQSGFMTDTAKKLALERGIYAPWLAKRGNVGFDKFDQLNVGFAQKINWTRALNPFVMLDFGAQMAELGVQRLAQAAADTGVAKGIFGKNVDVFRGVIQGIGVAILRPVRIVSGFLGNLSSLPGSRDSPILAVEETYKSQRNNISSASLSQADGITTSEFIELMNSKQVKKDNDGNLIRVPTKFDDRIQRAAYDAILALGKSPEAQNKKNASNPKFAELIALRNTLAVYESKSPKSSSDRSMIKLLEKSLNTQLTEMERSTAMTNQQPVIKEGPAAYGMNIEGLETAQEEKEHLLARSDSELGLSSPRSDTASSGSDSPRFEEDSLSDEESLGSPREAKAAVSAKPAGQVARTAGGKQYFNEVVFLPKTEKESKNLESALQSFVSKQSGGNESRDQGGKHTIVRFEGQKSVEYGEKGFVMRGFSESEYKEFKQYHLKGSTIKFQASASSLASMKEVLGGLGPERRLQTPLSRLGSLIKSASLFLQEKWAAVSPYIPFTAAYSARKTGYQPIQQSAGASESQVKLNAAQRVQSQTQINAQETKVTPKEAAGTQKASTFLPSATSAVSAKTERTSTRVSPIATPGRTPSAFRESLTVNVAIGREEKETAAVEKCLSKFDSYQIETKDGKPAQLYELRERTLTVEVTSELLSVKAVNPKEDDCKKVATLLKEVSPPGPKEVEVKSTHQPQKKQMVKALTDAGHTVVPSLVSREEKGFVAKNK